MIVRNYLEAPLHTASSHKGKGEVRSVKLFSEEDYASKLKFFYYMELPPGTSIGYHTHKENEEVYVIVEGHGVMTVNGEERPVKPGDVLLNKPGWSHGLENRSDEVVKVLVYEADL
ncbi:cupin domain-containing protein [Gorillibacterium sp. sgz5001074]|uniref:cupin domain-containing protein n=1 Tax=Gorillibacterium sp. sgz5001074 TaxID=3446695 RepID=UPI003F662FE3